MVVYKLGNSSIATLLIIMDHLCCSWLREQHAVAGGINSLFAPSLQSRMKLFVMNPMFTAPQAPTASPPQETPDQSFSEEITPLISSTPVGLGVNNTRHETTGFTLSTVKESDITAARKHQQVDMIVENPVFGSGLRLKKVHITRLVHYNYCDMLSRLIQL